MNKFSQVALLIFAFCLLGSLTVNPEKQLAKIKKTLEKELKVDGLLIKQSTKPGVFELWKGETPYGSLHFRRIVPKSEPMEYVVAFDRKGRIVFLKILNYSSSYGVQITLPKWSRKFLGKTTDELEVGRTVDGVSGATLSVKGVVGDLKEIK